MTKPKREHIVIPKLNLQILDIPIVGTAPYVQNAFSAKMRKAIGDKMREGSVGKNHRKRDPKDFQAEFENAKHQSPEGWYGIPSAAFRNAMVSACRLCGFPMTRAKLSVFIEADGYDAQDPSCPLTKIIKGEPVYMESVGRIQQTINLMARPMFHPGWEAVVRTKWDADQFNTSDILSLMDRVGQQVGVGEGRNDSPNSTGMGWGGFELKVDDINKQEAA